ncbi:Uncharacterised protein [uncultured archaeon]|nr:Uncharacterised protein [uncultured archaeon]
MLLGGSKWDGTLKSLTKDCGDKCPWHHKITDGPRLCLWGVAVKELCPTEKPRRCELFAGKRGQVHGVPTEQEKAVIEENFRIGLYGQNRRFRNSVHFHRLMTGQATLFPLVFPDKKI